MSSPRLLGFLSLILIALAIAVYLNFLLSTPYTGFGVAWDENTDSFIVTRADGWVSSQGLEPGDQIHAFKSPMGDRIQLAQRHFPVTSYQARNLYDSREARIEEMAKVFHIISHGSLIVELKDQQQLTLILSESRPLSSIHWELWLRFALGLGSWALGLLVWIWRPKAPEAVNLMLCGFGMFVLTFSGAAQVYDIEMFVPHPTLLYLLTLSIGIGDFIYIGFGTCVMLYFPQRLPRAHLLATLNLSLLSLYAIVTLLNDWDFNKSVTEQHLYFSYLETYLPMPFYLGLLFALSLVQFIRSDGLPVQRAQALWMALVWTTAPTIVILAYIGPMMMGVDSILTRTWTTVLLASAFFLVLLGVARLQLFNLERHVGVAAQWVIVTLVFVMLDLTLISISSLSAEVASSLLIVLILWVYFPLREWIYKRLNRDKTRTIENNLASAVGLLISNSLDETVDPKECWRDAVELLFNPVGIEEVQGQDRSQILDRGQSLLIAGHEFAPGLLLEFAQQGTRLFEPADIELSSTLELLFTNLYRSREAYFSGQEVERKRIIRDLHDDVTSRLLSMVHKSDNPEFLQSSQSALKALRDTIYQLDSEQTANIEDVLGEIRYDCSSRLADVGMKLNWTQSIEQNVALKPRTNVNLRKIFQELISNISKHGAPGDVKIEITQSAENLDLVVSNEIAQERSPQIPGKGLVNIQSRVSEIEGAVNWRESDGQFSVKLILPVRS